MSIQADRKVGTGHRIIWTHDTTLVQYIKIWTNKNDPISYIVITITVLFLLLAYNK